MEDPGNFETFSMEPELLVAIRFSASVPDILLEVTHPSATTTAGLKQLIRKKLPNALAKRRLRLIHAGKALEDGAALSVSLGLEFEPSDNIKGKRPIRGTEPPEAAPLSPEKEKRRIYIHCSISDIVLSDEELASEIQESRLFFNQHVGAFPDPSATATTATFTPSHDPLQDASSQTQIASTITPAPRGFDRLLSAGFTIAEVSALRSQFLALQSLTHTPDTMPSGEDLRRLEDRWMDEGSSEALPGGGDTGGIAGGSAFGNVSSDASGVLDDMLWGSVMGFFWPVGCGLWLLREEGVWSWRKGLAVFVGVVVNFGFGAVRWMN
ncbi:hypothetical protein PRK78_006319 [Emydomyces testavorans]|uniref:Ubiquitin-like domain-containing protein n=1 Tax=Emydomyces testavorans TaxID=2070801 RepID=A0AAF0DNY8_9EURO|nr:hypothetical protein PRK78_006319 [Emydomyces testavorans]